MRRYFYARKEITKTADAAAQAEESEINQRIFESSGDLTPTSMTWSNAQAFASMNNGYLSHYGIDAVVTRITVDTEKDTLFIQVYANLERLFPGVVPNVILIERGEANIRAFTH